MKLTNKQVKQIIKEELSKVLNENISEEKMLKLADILLSGEQGFRQAVLLLEPLGIITNYESIDKSKHYSFETIERYEHSFNPSPELMKAIASVLKEEIPGYNILPTGEEVLDGYDYSDTMGGSDHHRFEHKVQHGDTKCDYYFSIYPKTKLKSAFKDAIMNVYMYSERRIDKGE